MKCDLIEKTIWKKQKEEKKTDSGDMTDQVRTYILFKILIICSSDQHIIQGYRVHTTTFCFLDQHLNRILHPRKTAKRRGRKKKMRYLRQIKFNWFLTIFVQWKNWQCIRHWCLFYAMSCHWWGKIESLHSSSQS